MSLSSFTSNLVLGASSWSLSRTSTSPSLNFAAKADLSAARRAERGIRSSRVGVKVDRAGLETVARLAEEGVLTTSVDATYPAERFVDAYSATGKIVVTFR